MDTYYCAVLVVLHLAVVESLTPAVLSVQNVVEGTTASFECLFSAITSTSSLLIKKDGVTIYICGSLTFACSAFSADSDYSDVTFPGIGTTTGKGTFTVDNADQARDGGIWVCKYGSSLESAPVTFVVNVPTQAVLSVQNVVEGETATFECSYSSITSSMEITKDNVLMYECVNIALTCSALSAEADYSDVTFTGIGTTSGKGTFTVDNADQARDGGSWVCKYGSSLVSDPAIFVVNANSTCNDQTTPLPGLSEKQRIGIIAGGVGVVVVICCSICVCVIMRRNVNKNKRRRRQERRKALEANLQISESL